MKFSYAIGVDLGTATVLVNVQERGIVLNEPSVVAINAKTGKVLEVGERAKAMLGRTPDSVEAIQSLPWLLVQAVQTGGNGMCAKRNFRS